MFAFLSPRVLMLVGVIAALIGAFFTGVKFERGQNAEVELKKKAAYEAEVAQVRDKSRAVEEQTARALEAEQKKSQELSGRIERTMKELDARRVSGIKVNCPRSTPARALLLVKTVPDARPGSSASSPASSTSSTNSPGQPGQVASAASMNTVADQATPISSTEAETENETVDIALDDHIFYADFVGLYNAAATRQPERLSQAPGGPDGGSAAASSVSGRDIIDNVDENGKRFAECREKLKAWQNWARKMDLAK